MSPAQHSDERPSLALTLSGEAGFCVVCPAEQEVWGSEDEGQRGVCSATLIVWGL